MAISRRTKWAILLGILVLLVGGPVTSIYLPPWLEHRRVERLLAEFRTSPSQATSEPLIQTLFDGRASQADGDAVLAELLKPKEPRYCMPGYSHRDQAPGRIVDLDVDLCHPECGLLQNPSEGILSLAAGFYSTQLRGSYSGSISIEGHDQDPEPRVFAVDQPNRGSVFIGFAGSKMSSTSARSEFNVGSFAVFRPGTYKGTIALGFEFHRDISPWRPTPWYESMLKRFGLAKDAAKEESRAYKCAYVLPFEAHVSKDAWAD